MTAIDLSHSDTLELIAAFRSHPVIYDSSTTGYNDRKMKAEAWRAISERINVDPEICKRKMESLMASYRREKKNILRAKEKDAVYEPKWRYWNLFKFLRGIADDEEDPLGKTPDNMPDPKSNSQWSTIRMLAHKYQDVPYPIEPVHKTESKENYPEENDQNTSFGLMVDTRLRSVSKSQRIFAENLINQALYRGLLFQLSARSEVVDVNTNPPEVVAEIAPKDSHFIAPIEYNVPVKRRRESLSPNSRECSETSVETLKDMTVL